MRIDTLKCLARLGAGLLLTAACERATPTPSAAATAPAAEPTKAATPTAATAPTPPAESVKLAEVREDVPLPLTALLGHPRAEVEAKLGEPEGKSMSRSTCFRFAPGRTHFKCGFATQAYADRTGNFRSLRIAYEDGIASAVAYDGWKHGSGAFTPDALLAAVGLTLPEPGKAQQPAEGVRLWTWSNSQARLLIADRQYRVEASIVGEDWSRSRLEVTLNQPLTPEQQALIVPSAGKGPAQSNMSSEPGAPAPAAP